MRIEGVDIEAVFGCVPENSVDNVAGLTALVGAEKAESIVKATGFTKRRVAPDGTDVIDLALPAAKRALEGTDPAEVGGIVAVSFSNRDRFPALSARLQHELGLPTSIAAYDISMACSGWVYGLCSAAQMVRLTGKKVLLVDGDVQSAWTDRSDANTLAVMGDGASATLLAPGDGVWDFAFYTDGGGADALRCRETISMDGFGVFRFVAGPVRKFLATFIQKFSLPMGTDPSIPVGTDPVFVPHQANMYMVRQLADALKLRDHTIGSGAKYANTGSCSAALSMADGMDGLSNASGRTPVLIAGFGAGLSAAAAATTVGAYRKGVVEV
jgi:3-oxoacyl-[acyl-carrier-protein] synthase-3